MLYYKYMFGKLNFFAGEKRETQILIHPDFKITGDCYDDKGKLRWCWNWNEFKPRVDKRKYGQPVKLAFAFDDPGLLNNCPYMCKIGENIGANQETKFYGVAYAIEENSQELCEWGQRFPHAKLISDIDPLSGQTTNKSKIEYVKKENDVAPLP